jgi:hypothetical protein
MTTVDYQEFTTRETPEGERRRLGVGDIWCNSVKCCKCNTIIRSKNRHDYVTCRCGDVAVDGGSWYRRFAFKDGADWIDLSESYDDAKEQ